MACGYIGCSQLRIVKQKSPDLLTFGSDPFLRAGVMQVGRELKRHAAPAFISSLQITMRQPLKNVVHNNIACCAAEHTKRSRSISLPCGKTQLIMGGISSVLGPLLDNYHSQFEVLQYKHPIELSFGLFGANMNVTTAWFTSPLFILAGLIITNGVTWLDSIFGRGIVAEDMNVPKALATVCMFCSIYYLSGALSQNGMPQLAAQILAVMGILEWYFMDRSIAGVTMGALTAICGPMLEVGLINIGHLYSYNEWDVLGIPWMIVAVYFAGGPAVGNLARAVDAAVCKKQPEERSE